MKPLIIITNDDGVFAPGIKALAEAVDGLGEILIVAPRFEQSGMGHSYPKSENNGIIEEVSLVINGKPHIAYGVHGSPAQALSHGVMELCNRKPDLCLSGINKGENLGASLTASGTIGAAISASCMGIPAIALSQETYASNNQDISADLIDWETVKYISNIFTKKVLEEGLPNNVALYNINVPNAATKDTEIRYTRQSRSNQLAHKQPEKRDFSKPYRFKLELADNLEKLEKDSDIYAINIDKVISVTPLGWDSSVL